MTSTIKHLCLMFALGCLLVGSPVTAVAAPGAGDPVDLIGVRVTDVTGHHHRIGVSTGAVQPAVLVFLDTACPVATRYVPTLNALHAEAEARGVALYGVLSNPAITWQASADFVDDFGVTFPVILDSTGDLAQRLGPRVTSESFVISTGNRARTALGWTRSRTTATSRRCSKPTASNAIGRAASRRSPSKATTTRNAGTVWLPS